MAHSAITANMASFRADIAAASAANKSYVFGETNSATGGGAAQVSPTFGAALWVADVSLRAVSEGVRRLYFHHGTVGNCQYCWWGRYSMGSPYYGAVFASAALGYGSFILPLDNGTDSYAAYATYSDQGRLMKVAIINTVTYNSTGIQRDGVVMMLCGLDEGTRSARRLTAKSALSRVDQGENPAWGGQSYANGTCKPTGTESLEVVEVSSGCARVQVGDSEAVLVYI
jgi:hypothetical protein